MFACAMCEQQLDRALLYFHTSTCLQEHVEEICPNLTSCWMCHSAVPQHPQRLTYADSNPRGLIHAIDAGANITTSSEWDSNHSHNHIHLDSIAKSGQSSAW